MLAAALGTAVRATGAVGREIGVHEAVVFGGFAAALRAGPGVGGHYVDGGGIGELEICEVDILDLV